MDPTHRMLGTVELSMAPGQPSGTPIYANRASSSSLDQPFLNAPTSASGTSSQRMSLSPSQANNSLDLPSTRSGFFLEPNVQESHTFRIGDKQLGGVRLNEATISQLFAQ